MKKIIPLILALAMIFPFSACNNKSNSDEIKTTVNSFFYAIQNYDMGKFDSFFKDADEIKAAKIIDSKTPQYSYMKQKAIEITYEIQDIKEKGNSAETTVLCSYFDMTNVYSTMMRKAYELVLQGVDVSVTGEEFDNLVKQAFDQALSSNPPQKNTKSITIKLNKDGDKWYIEGNMDIANMVTGNLAETLSGLNSEN